jgi:Ala-tRNA(Pro) deacylase
MPLKKLKDFLDGEGVKYTVISHSPAYTAQEIAASAHVPGKNMAKTVMVKIDGEMAMAVLPASHGIDFEQLRQVAYAESADLAKEEEFRDLFPDCELGAMPPFGNLYGMKVFVEQSLSEDDEIAFNAGSHKELVRVSYDDFARLVDAKVARFS